MSGILVKIRQGMETFSPSEQKISKYILESPEKVLNLTISRLAENSGASEATIVRFCRTLGLKKYQDLKLAISTDLTSPIDGSKIIYDQFERNDSTQNIIEKISLGNSMAIQDTLKVLDPNQLDKAIDYIDSAKKVYIYGIGASSVVGLDVQYKFMRINIPTFMYFDSHIQLTSAVHIEKDDVVIAISNSGKTKEVIDILGLAKEKGAKTIVITQYGESPILEVSDVKLFTASVENNFRSAAMASRIAQLNIIDCIYIGLACRRYDEVIDHLTRTRQVLEHKKK